MSLCWWFSEEVARKKGYKKVDRTLPESNFESQLLEKYPIRFRCFRQNIIIDFAVCWVSTLPYAQWALELNKTFDGFPTIFQQLECPKRKLRLLWVSMEAHETPEAYRQSLKFTRTDDESSSSTVTWASRVKLSNSSWQKAGKEGRRNFTLTTKKLYLSLPSNFKIHLRYFPL